MLQVACCFHLTDRNTAF